MSDSHVYVGWCIPAAIEAGDNLDYIHIYYCADVSLPVRSRRAAAKP